VETEVKRKPGAYITEDQIKVIQAKEWLTLKEVDVGREDHVT
jgi:hypothetical protein